MASTSLPRTTATSIPSITSLRKALDYGDPKLPRCNAFYDDVRAFRKKFRTSNGVDGLSLIDWKSREHQLALSEMTAAYLDREGNGQIFWPDNDAAPNRNNLQYSQHNKLIKRLIKQLFFRLNLQQYRNHKYKSKAKSEPGGADSMGRSTADAIVVDDIDPMLDVYQPLRPNQSPGAEDPPAGTTHCGDQASALTLSILNGHNRVYDVPESPRPGHTALTSSEASRAEGKRTVADEDPGSSPRQVKKTKVNNRRPNNSKQRKSRKNHPPPPNEIRRSPRDLKKVQRADQITGDAYTEAITEAIASPEPSESPTPPEKPINRPVIAPAEASWAPLERGMTGGGQSTPCEPERPSTADMLRSYNPPGPTQREDTPRPPFTPLPTPSSVPGRLQESQQASEQQDKPKPTPPSELRVEFNYHITQRTPKLIYRSWSPKGKFQDKTLQELIEELALEGEVTGLTFTLEGPGLDMVEEISRDRSSQFESMKRKINKFIRAWLADPANSGEVLTLDIDIEPMRADSVVTKGETDEGTFW